MIYLSIHFSHVGLDVTLDYDNINTIFLLFQNKISTFLPFEIVPLVFLKGKRVTIFYFFPFYYLFVLNCSFFFFKVLLLFLDTFLGVFVCMVEKIGFEKVCLKLKE